MKDYLLISMMQKIKVLCKMLEYVDGTKEDVVVFGDDYNDLIMFKPEWTSIAMGNACEELKKKASFVTKEVTMMVLNMPVNILDGFNP